VLQKTADQERRKRSARRLAGHRGDWHTASGTSSYARQNILGVVDPLEVPDGSELASIRVA
jgi:hypothetical protein